LQALGCYIEWCSHDKLNMNHDNTYKQTEGRIQPMQVDVLKVSLRSTSTPTSKVGGRCRKGLYFDCVYSYKDRVPNIYSPES